MLNLSFSSVIHLEADVWYYISRINRLFSLVQISKLRTG